MFRLQYSQLCLALVNGVKKIASNAGWHLHVCTVFSIGHLKQKSDFANIKLGWHYNYRTFTVWQVYAWHVSLTFTVLTNWHFLFIHLCFFHPGPPNFFISQQLLHTLQSDNEQPSHEHRGLLAPETNVNYTYIQCIIKLVLYGLESVCWLT